MKSKNLCIILVTALVLVSSCAAYAEGVKLGMLPSARERLQSVGDAEIIRTALWKVGSPAHAQGLEYKFYDNLANMLMALNAGECNEILVPKLMGEYIIGLNPEYEVCCVFRIQGSYLSFGFKESDGVILQRNFNTALRSMKKDGTLDDLLHQYCANPGKDSPESVKFEEFPKADTVRVAVTGDLPPVDYVAADGTPAGFSTAVLAEIGRRLKVNIKLIQVDTAARTPALMSGRADAVFWYQFIKGAQTQPDAPEGVIFSEPYYDWDTFLHIRKK